MSKRIKAFALVLGAIWVAFAFNNILCGGRLNVLGIRPGFPLNSPINILVVLVGIFCAPFLHGDYDHIMSNTKVFIAVGLLAIAQDPDDFWAGTIVIAAIAGIGTYLIGEPGTIHIGYSGVLFGQMGYVIGRGIFERSWPAISFGVVCAIVSWPYLPGLFPEVGNYGISWEAHLCGFLGGIAVGYLLAY